VVGLHGAIARLMENRREAAGQIHDSAALADLLVRLQERVPPAQGVLLSTFTRELFAKVEPSVLSGSDPETLADLALGAFRFLLERRRETHIVRVFRPEKSRNGWDAPFTVVETVLDDHPFIVDTVCETLRQQGGEIRLLLHPLLGVGRGEDGTLEQLGSPARFPTRESFLHVEVSEVEPSRSLEVLLTERLRQVVLASRDYAAMKRRVSEISAEVRSGAPAARWAEEAGEVSAFLDWLAEKNFVYLGLREYRLSDVAGVRRAMVRGGSGLGILRDDGRSRYCEPRSLEPELERRITASGPFIVSKTNSQSPIHRFVPMTDIFLASADESGRIRGGHRLLGLFTSKAYSEPAGAVPILRARLATLLAEQGAVEDSYDHKDLVSLFNSISKEELLASRPEDLSLLVRAIRAVQPAAGIRLVCRADAWRRGLLAVVIVPHARFSTELHGRVTAVLRRGLGATVLHEHLALDERPQVRLHYYLGVPPRMLDNPPVSALERDLDELLWTWDDELGAELGKAQPPAAVERLLARYRLAFPPAYKAATGLADAVRDIHCVEALIATGKAQIELVPQAPREAGGRVTALKLYSSETLVLSEFIPVLENLGLRVFGEERVDLAVSEGGDICIRTFFVQASADRDLDVVSAAAQLVPALHAVRGGEVENDRLNGLVLLAGLDWREVDLLRTYIEHARQVGLGTRETLIDALVDHPESARLLLRFFAARHDPAGDRTPGRAEEAEERFLSSLDAVDSLVQDNILRALAATVGATLRTNFYARSDRDGETAAIAIKLDASRLPHLPEPRPMFETYVHGRCVEGIHLRSGRVARGGIRLSDRTDDFRGEILGLMKTQVVKNAVIVPVGAKGGFIVKGRLPGAPPAGESAERAYRTLIEALLSITDNLEDGQVAAPRGVVVHDDEPDPYLVVAADKGTATYSDLANRLAAERRFWLGDAFASGGRSGYDHKKLGITARGAWECARHHFHEMGRDIERDPITVVGIGDMSGDVFGNGMLRSRTIRLAAAFNHRDVFIDPEPDAERSYRERERLFALPASSWTDYDRSCLSAGGGVFSRAAKSIALTPEMRAVLGIDAPALSGEDLVRAVLRMQADLLWVGGIGTYVKASDEAHAEVGDPANDRLRIDAAELRVKVIAEGGNLGLTQRARVEFALAGGRINTDAIDNSGGVDCSDHEVNLKIALRPVVASGQLSHRDRDELLAACADEVCRVVLAHNRRQALALTLDQVRSRSQLATFRDLVAPLEAEGGLDRQLHHLPARETLRARRGTYLGLTRPELAVLLAYTKLDLRRRILETSLCDERDVEACLWAYFPEPVVRRFESALRGHALRREIIAVELVNRLVDLMGTTFAYRTAADVGHPVVAVVKAWTAAWLISDGEDLLRRTSAESAALPAEAVQHCYFAIERALERATKWVIENQSLDGPLNGIVSRFDSPVRALLAAWGDLLPDELGTPHRAEAEELVGLGIEPDLAERLTKLSALEDALEISHIAIESRLDPRAVAKAYFETATLIDLDWVRRALPSTVAGEDRWERRAVGGLLEGLMYARRNLTVSVLRCRQSGELDGCVEAYAEAHRAQIERVTALIHDLKAAPQPTLPAMLVVMRELGRLAR
jgi:glutamate dehydrogenase